MGNEIAHWVITVLTVVALIVTWVRKESNHHSDNNSGKPNTMLFDSQIEHIKDMLNHPDYGLSALQKQISGFKEHCASVSTRLTEQVTHHEKRITGLEQTRK